MRRTIGALLMAVILASCVSTRTTPVSDGGLSAWHGKTVALTARPRAGFMAVTAGKAAFALVGAVAMSEAGKSIVTENDIQDPAPRLGLDLLNAAQAQYGVLPSTVSPVPIDTTDIPKLAQAAGGAALLFDVQSMGADFRYLPTEWAHYVVDSQFKLRIVDVGAARLIAEGFCVQSTKDDKIHPTKDELLANKAARLKEILDAQREACLGQFKTNVLNIRT